MKRSSLKTAEILYTLSFFLYLFGSSVALIEHGTELSLWLMTLALLISASTTILPTLGIQWLRMNNQGSQAGRRLSLFLQITSWGTFSTAMYYRLGRNFPPFYGWIVITTLTWAAWLLLLIFSRYIWNQPGSGDKLNNNASLQKSTEEEGQTQ